MFDLVAESGRLLFSEDGWLKARSALLEMQPARHVALHGNPPSRIRVTAYGDEPEVAPAILARLEELAGVPLRVEPRK